ncbi:hypothetical protein TCAL_14816 [Tigriopus californicus]|uniref:C2 domain-containing protein n=1 Tax=Tigriopus californicus TaxID=6832 RepID=A0A553PPF1_TIGCA|nr:hypothetical protein TCAL_14816 [Tigriopus californicus]
MAQQADYMHAVMAQRQRRGSVTGGVQVELAVSCRNLRPRDHFSAPDPVCLVFIKSRGSRQWKPLGRTEMLKNETNPEWVKTFLVDFYFEEKQVWVVFILNSLLGSLIMFTVVSDKIRGLLEHMDSLCMVVQLIMHETLGTRIIDDWFPCVVSSKSLCEDVNDDEDDDDDVTPRRFKIGT